MRLLQHLPDPTINPGDLVVVRGIKKSGMAIWKETALAGTPWIAPGITKGPKWKWLLDQIAQYSVPGIRTRFHAFGIGSCVNLDQIKTGVKSLMNTDEIEEFKTQFGNMDSVTTRDPLAQNFFEQIGVESKLEVCPSIYALDGETLPDLIPNSTLVIAAKCWHNDVWPEPPHIPGATYVDYAGLQQTEDQAIEQLKYFSLFERIISQRVHAIIPLSKHRECYIVPVDSRYLTATHAGIPVWKPKTK